MKTLHHNTTVKMAYFTMLEQVRQCFVIACWCCQGLLMTHTSKVQCMLSPFDAFVLCIRCFLFICCAREICLDRGLGMVTGTSMNRSTVKSDLPKYLAVQGDLHQAAPRLAAHLVEGLTQAYWRAPTWRAFLFLLKSTRCPEAASWLHYSQIAFAMVSEWTVCGMHVKGEEWLHRILSELLFVLSGWWE